jgi:hypothetical protein
MTRRGLAFLAAFVAASLAAESARAVSLYLEDFTDPQGDGGALADVGWNGDDSIGSAGSSSGIFNTFHWWYNNSTIASALTPSGLSYTTENPAIPTATSGLTISWAHRLENQFDDAFGEGSGTGTGVDVRPAVQIAGVWYASATPVSTGNVEGAFVTNSLVFNGAAANWVLVSDVDATAGVTLGAAPGSALSGNITGVGLVSTFHQYQTVNFDFVEVTSVPEPMSAGLLGCGLIGLAACRRRRAR